MPRIRCHYSDCVFIDEGFCTAAAVEVDPDEGCMTYSRSSDVEEDRDEDWDEEEELEEMDEWDEMDFGEEEEETWVDDEEESY